MKSATMAEIGKNRYNSFSVTWDLPNHYASRWHYSRYIIMPHRVSLWQMKLRDTSTHQYSCLLYTSRNSERIVSWASALLARWHCLAPKAVSYTHLIARAFSLSFVIVFLKKVFSLFRVEKPVSYTHLDVYKRQLYYS